MRTRCESWRRRAVCRSLLATGACCAVAGATVLGAFGASATAATQKRALLAGWGAPATFLGRYQMTAGAIASPASRASGVFTAATEAANSVVLDADRPTGGELTLFMRIVKKTLPPEPSGILSVSSRAGSWVVYLTALTQGTAGRAALVNGGSFLGPVIGALHGRVQGDIMTTSVTVPEVGTLNLRFRKFSSTPAP